MPDQQPSPYNDILLAINPIVRQLDRLEERTRNIVTRTDLEALRKELVARESLEPQLNTLKAQIDRVDDDRHNDRIAVDKRIDGIEAEQVTKQDRLWIRLSQAAAFGALALTIFQFLSHLRFFP